MRETWPWQLAVDSAALTLLACDLATRDEALTKIEIDLPALARSQADAAWGPWLQARNRPTPRATGTETATQQIRTSIIDS
jgi:hypothetical protein